MSSSVRFTLFVCAVLLGLIVQGPATAYPGSVNLIPCADMIGAWNARFAYESDGLHQPFSKDYVQYIYTEFGVGDRCEIGVDLLDTARSTQKMYNAKFLLREESKGVPAIAVGAWNVSDATKPTYYGCGCKSFGTLRLHVGGMTSSGDTCLLLGADKKITKTLTLLADYQSGPGRWGTVGLYWQATPQIAVDAYYARDNTAELRDTGDYVGLNVAYTFRMK